MLDRPTVRVFFASAQLDLVKEELDHVFLCGSYMEDVRKDGLFNVILRILKEIESSSTSTHHTDTARIRADHLVAQSQFAARRFQLSLEVFHALLQRPRTALSHTPHLCRQTRSYISAVGSCPSSLQRPL